MKPLDSIAKRDLLAATKFNAENVRAYAEDFLKEGRHGDAFAFYRKLNDTDGVRRVTEAAIREAEPEVLWSVQKAYPDMISRQNWAQCGENAMKMGKLRSAAYVFERIGDAARLAEAEKGFKPAEEAPPADESPSAE